MANGTHFRDMNIEYELEHIKNHCSGKRKKMRRNNNVNLNLRNNYIASTFNINSYLNVCVCSTTADSNEDGDDDVRTQNDEFNIKVFGQTEIAQAQGQSTLMKAPNATSNKNSVHCTRILFAIGMCLLLLKPH